MGSGPLANAKCPTAQPAPPTANTTTQIDPGFSLLARGAVAWPRTTISFTTIDRKGSKFASPVIRWTRRPHTASHAGPIACGDNIKNYWKETG